MLNDELPSTSSMLSPPPAAAAAAAAGSEASNDAALDNHSHHPTTVDCLQIPRLSARLYYVRSASVFLRSPWTCLGAFLSSELIAP